MHPSGSPIKILLVGGMRIGSPVAGDYSFYADLFSRMAREVPNTGELTRYVAFDCFADGARITFLGIEVDRIDGVPDGMVAWQLDEKKITVLDGRCRRDPLPWQREVSWLWLDHSSSSCGRDVTGEFIVRVPAEWTQVSVPMDCPFSMTGNAYVAPGQAGCDDSVELVDYDEAWPEQFSLFAEWLRNHLGDVTVCRVEHFGSTAIPGMIAKPVIDVLVEVPSLEQAKPRMLPRFIEKTWEYWWLGQHMAFVKRKTLQGVRTHHVHIMESGEGVTARLAFRDYLRAHPDDAARYAEMKRRLAATHRSNREKYTDAKSAFIAEVVRKATVKSNSAMSNRTSYCCESD
ncbi:MAG: GrpB family protein [Syntrophotaleaceae bacterium]